MPTWLPWQLHPPEGVANWQWFVVLGVGAGLFIYVVVRFAVPVIAGMLAERQRQIAEMVQQVEETLADTRATQANYRERLEHIEDAMEARMTEALREAEVLRAHILEEAREASAALLERARDEVEQERRKEHVRLRQEYVRRVVDAAGYAASRSLDEAEQHRLVSEFTSRARVGA